MSKVQVPPEKVALYDALIATHPEIERKGKNLLYTSVNGHMFTVFNTDAMLGIRLSKEDGAAFEERYESGPFLSYGAKMCGYVLIPDELLARTDELAPYLAASFDYVKSLEPKPTTKKKK